MKPREQELVDFPVIRYESAAGKFVANHKYTSIECYLDIYLNDRKLTTSFCSPSDHEDLVTGILAQMGQIRRVEDVVELCLDETALEALCG